MSPRCGDGPPNSHATTESSCEQAESPSRVLTRQPPRSPAERMLRMRVRRRKRAIYRVYRRSMAVQKLRRSHWLCPPPESSLSPARTYQTIAAGQIDSVKFGASRIIRTDPRTFLPSLGSEVA
jgi:hypothetical protein